MENHFREDTVLKVVVCRVLEERGKKWKLLVPSLTSPLDDMSSRIDDLEKNIADLMTQAGVEELDGENKIPATQKS